jgi:hypothetical protein
MNFNNNCKDLKKLYVNNSEDLDECIKNVFSIECPEKLEDIKNSEEYNRCKEQFNYLGWKKNECWIPEYNGIPTNAYEYSKLNKKQKKKCNDLFRASYSNKDYNLNDSDILPWNIMNYNNIHLKNKINSKLCPREKTKFLKTKPYVQNECFKIYNNFKNDINSHGGCGVFNNEWLGCSENQHYNSECTKCLDD